MKLLMTVQPKNGEKPSEPMLIDTNESDLCCLADDFLRTGDKVLIFQPISEYHAAASSVPCACDNVKQFFCVFIIDNCEDAPFYYIKICLYRVRNFSHARAN